ncbi:hypothetical protein DVH24_024924 [Malus domestica]|uniref:Uncharacterized protein n=1 Tax=Malus domestica TaxID=3750 RepID=A0A498JI50_MALDO|nr:hypothetical protein DVH24_024924 [Malus domestica]
MNAGRANSSVELGLGVNLLMSRWVRG